VITRRLLAVLLLATACRAPAPAPVAKAFEGPGGESVVVASLPVRRIISTMQSATEWLVALHAESLLVARTDFDRQPELAHLPSIGGGLDPSAEVIADLRPDVVLGWRIRSSVDLARALGPFGIPVVAVEATDTAGVYQQAATIGALIGRKADADWAAYTMRAELTELRATACADGEAPETVVLEISAEPPMTVGARSWMSQLLVGACLTNAFADLEAPWPQVSMEAIAARRPRWILTSRGDTPGARLAALRALPGWRDLEAVRRGRVLEIDGDLFSRAGPRLPEWVRAVRAERRRLVDTVGVGPGG
jgi:ABC-type Fe3+-hydroxamate transport system substrate-binding protein